MQAGSISAIVEQSHMDAVIAQGRFQTPDTGYSCTQAMETVTLRVSALPAMARSTSLNRNR